MDTFKKIIGTQISNMNKQVGKPLDDKNLIRIKDYAPVENQN